MVLIASKLMSWYVILHNWKRD